MELYAHAHGAVRTRVRASRDAGVHGHACLLVVAGFESVIIILADLYTL